MISLDAFWGFINHRPGLTATAGEWSARLGTGGWDILRPRLFVSDGIARACAHVAGGPTLKVVPMANRKYGLVCETTGNLEHSGLTESEIRAYRLNVTVLRTLIAEAIGISPDSERVRDDTGALPVGTWAPVVAANIPIFMLLPPTSIRLASEVRRLLNEVDGCFLLLVPQLPKLEAALNARLQQRQAMVVRLNEIIECSNSGQLSATPAWQTYTNAYCQRHLSDRMVPAEPEYQFARRGMWAIRFAGNETFLEGDLNTTTRRRLKNS